MLKEAIEKLLTLAAPNLQQVGGRDYSDRALVPVQRPHPSAVQLVSLQGLVDLIRERIDSISPLGVAVHVESYNKVALIAKYSDEWGRRLKLIEATPVKTDSFNFGSYLEHENFIVGVLSHFAKTDDRDYIVRVASTLTANAETVSEDDGITQKVTTRKGAVIQTTEALRNRVTLAPYRTFPEVNQVAFATEFIFRVRSVSDKQPPNLALFEADGGRWKVEAINEVRRWLAVQITDIPIIA